MFKVCSRVFSIGIIVNDVDDVDDVVVVVVVVVVRCFFVLL